MLCRRALVSPRENQALVHVLGLPPFVRPTLHVVDVPLDQGVEHVVRVHVVGPLHRIDDEHPAATRASLRGVEREERVPHRLGRVGVADREHITREIDREDQLRCSRVRSGSLAREAGIGVRVRKPAHHGAHGGPRVAELVVGSQRAVGGELPA